MRNAQHASRVVRGELTGGAGGAALTVVYVCAVHVLLWVKRAAKWLVDADGRQRVVGVLAGQQRVHEEAGARGGLLAGWQRVCERVRAHGLRHKDETSGRQGEGACERQRRASGREWRGRSEAAAGTSAAGEEQGERVPPARPRMMRHRCSPPSGRLS